MSLLAVALKNGQKISDGLECRAGIFSKEGKQVKSPLKASIIDS